jgi:hypothetical protein
VRDLVELYWELRDDAKKSGDEVAQLFGVENHEDPASFFGMAFNSITMTLELLDHYYNLWGKLNQRDFLNVEETREQNGQRVILLQKMCFIEVMSSFEFCAKKVVLENESLFGEFKGRIYLTGIMERSQKKGILNESQINLWRGASKLRNSLIHNNGIAEDNVQYEYPNVTVTLQENLMIQGNLKLFALVTKWLLREARLWIENANNAN